MKPVFQALVAIIVIAALAALTLSFSIDNIVESNLERMTSQMLDTNVEVNDVRISILDGKGKIKGVTIYNSADFSDNPALELREVSLRMDLLSLLSDTVVVNEVRIKEAEFYYEQKVSGSNINALADKFDGVSNSETCLVVDYLLVENGRVKLAAQTSTEKSLSAEFSQVELDGVGRRGNNAIQKTLQQILKPIFQKADREAVKRSLADKNRKSTELVPNK